MPAGEGQSRPTPCRARPRLNSLVGSCREAPHRALSRYTAGGNARKFSRICQNRPGPHYWPFEQVTHPKEPVMKRRSTKLGRSSRSLSKAVQLELLEERRLMANVSGTVVWDTNNSQTIDGSDVTLNNFTVYVDVNNDGALNPGEP